jgi:DNA-binding response OmpR family regulator
VLKVFAAAEGHALEVHGWGGAPAIAAASALRRRPVVGGRVLVIGAEEEIAAIGQALAEDGLVLRSASDRLTALMQVSETAPDLVIIDQDLPDGDGAALIQPLRCRLGRRTLPILLLTARPDIRGALRRSGAAATDYLAKPFRPPMLRTRVRAWLARTLLGDYTRPWRPHLQSQPCSGAV